MKHIIISTLLAIFLYSCIPQGVEPEVVEFECNANVCVINNTRDTVFFCWNCNNLSDTLLPGEKTCDSSRTIFVKEKSSRVYSTQFQSNKGSITIEVNDCEITEYLNDRYSLSTFSDF